MLCCGVLNRDKTFCGIDLIEPMDGICGAGWCTLGDVVDGHRHQSFDPGKGKVIPRAPESANKLWRLATTLLQATCIVLRDVAPTLAPGEVRPLGRRHAE